MNNLNKLPQYSTLHYPAQQTHNVNPLPYPQTPTMGLPQRVNQLSQSLPISNLQSIPHHILLDLVSNLNFEGDQLKEEGDQLREKVKIAENENSILRYQLASSKQMKLQCENLKKENDQLRNQLKSLHLTCQQLTANKSLDKQNAIHAAQANLDLIKDNLRLKHELNQTQLLNKNKELKIQYEDPKSQNFSNNEVVQKKGGSCSVQVEGLFSMLKI